MQKNRNTPIVYKSYTFDDIKADINSRKVSGYFAAFDIIDADNDIIRKGAFLKSIQERGPQCKSNRKIKYLHQHLVREIAGPLLHLEEDSKGLLFEGEIEKTSLGDIILERYSNGTYNEHSIGFKYVWDKCNWLEVPTSEKDEEGRDISDMVLECKELMLFEGSVVTFGANSETPFLGFKGSHKDLINELDKEMEFLIKKAPNYDYELEIRRLFAKQYSLLSLLAEDTKETVKPKPEQKKGLNLEYLKQNLKK